MTNSGLQNKRLLQVYAITIRVIGWMLVVTGGIAGLLVLFAVLKSGSGLVSLQEDPSLSVFKRSWFVVLAPGVVALGISQFIRYLCADEYKPGWLLRQGDKILYLCALLIAYPPFVVIIFNKTYLTQPFGLWLLCFFLPCVLLTVGKVLILVGIGQILHRIVPLIKESRDVPK
jgi:hypothetical protein